MSLINQIPLNRPRCSFTHGARRPATMEPVQECTSPYMAALPSLARLWWRPCIFIRVTQFWLSISFHGCVRAHGNWLFSTFHKSWGWGHAGDQEEYQSGLQQGTHPLQTLHIPVYASPSISYLPFFAEFNCLTPTPLNSKQRYSESCMSSRTSYVECLVLEACYCFKISMKRKKIWVLDGSKLG